ncbi:MAG: substrate-binding domain-containing protein, partial [Bifidobacteriaceae bacterium]|nr:substrate-binding domain-containing protein [Bifidobacteriaceae bacterium]
DATGTAYHPNWVVRAPDWSYEAGLAAAAELFNRCPTLDGVFGANDAFAAAAVTLAQEQGRNVPDDIGVVGFDNSRWATWTRPHLSTVAQPTETLGERMADLVVRQLAGEDLRGALITEPTRLVWRGSA